MGFLSKAWKGIKKTVKKVARTVKKVTKKVVTALPGGKKLWSAGTKVLKGIHKGIKAVGKGIMKVATKVGPLGMMALSMVLGPAAGAVWSGFGSGAQLMAQSANGLIKALGTAGQSIFSSGNFIGGTLGSMGNAITEGASQLMAGNFSAAGNAFTQNISNAFTGKAGMASVHAANTAAAKSALVSATDTAAREALTQSHASNLGKLTKLRNGANAALSDTINQKVGDLAIQDATISNMTPDSILSDAQHSKYIADTYGTTGIEATTNTEMYANANASLYDKTMKAGKAAVSLLNQGQGQEGGQMAMPMPIDPLKATTLKSVGAGGGTGSSGFSLLDPVRGLKESVTASQQRMFS